jgi:hypothetical protein
MIGTRAGSPRAHACFRPGKAGVRGEREQALAARAGGSGSATTGQALDDQ